jgi:hypothetical protein
MMLGRFCFGLVCGIVLTASVCAQKAQNEKKTPRNADIVAMAQNHRSLSSPIFFKLIRETLRFASESATRSCTP